MFADFIWTILGIIGLLVVLTIVWATFFAYKIRKRMHALVKTFDHHPTSPTRKEVATISSETVEEKDN